MYGCVLSVLLGLLLPAFSSRLLIADLALGALCILGGLYFTKQKRFAIKSLLCAFMFIFGFAISHFAHLARLHDTLAEDKIDTPLWIHAEIIDLPQVTDEGSRLLLRQAQSSQVPGTPQTLQVHARGHDWHAGWQGDFLVRLKPIHSVHNFYGFDAEAWAFTAGIGAQGTLLETRERITQAASIEGYIQALRDQIRERFNLTLKDHPARPMLIALSVGDASEVNPNTWTTLWRTGVGHLISISGVHVTLFAELIKTLATRFWQCSPLLCRRISARWVGGIMGLSAALTYALIAGFSIPTQRTLYMHLVLMIADLLRHSLSGPLIWLSALALVLLGDPCALQNPSLWLSFGAVGGLILSDWGFFGRRKYWASEWHAQWVVNIALLPMIVFWFNQLSLISPLANLIAIPWVGYLVTPLTLLSMLPMLSGISILPAFLMEQLLRLLGVLGEPRWAALDLASPDVLALFVGAYSALALIAPWHSKYRGYFLLGLLPLIIPAAKTPSTGHARIEVIDVGQGLSLSVRTENHTLLYDTGPRIRAWDSGSRILIPLFKAEGIQRLDRVILSHPDLDHVGGYESVKAALPIGSTDAGFLKKEASPCLQGTHWVWDGVAFSYLYPPDPPIELSRNSHARNNHACVLEISAGEHRILLPADIEASAEDEILPQLHPVDVVIAPHHGSYSSSTPAFIKALHPSHVIVSAGYRNHFHHPDPEVVERWRASGAQIWRTDAWGALRIELSPEGVELRPARTQEYSLGVN